MTETNADFVPLAKVIIHQSIQRPWGTLMTGSSPDPDRIYVGSKKWRDRIAAAKSNERK